MAHHLLEQHFVDFLFWQQNVNSSSPRRLPWTCTSRTGPAEAAKVFLFYTLWVWTFFSAFDTHHFITHQHSSTSHHQKSDVHHCSSTKKWWKSHGTQPPWPQRTALLPVLRSRGDPQLAAALLAAAGIELLPTARPKFGIWTMNHGFHGWRALWCFICNFDRYWL